MSNFKTLPQEIQDKILYMSNLEYKIALNKYFFNTYILGWIKIEGEHINAMVESMNDDRFTVSWLLKETMQSVDLAKWSPLYEVAKM